MTRHPRKLVVRFVEKLRDPPFDVWGTTTFAELECGHLHHVGETYRPKRMACGECQGAREVGRRAITA